MPPQGAEAKNYIIFGHSLHSILQAPICLYEAMPSHGINYPDAPFPFIRNLIFPNLMSVFSVQNIERPFVLLYSPRNTNLGQYTNMDKNKLNMNIR